jgi:hypothetical protein
MEKLEQDVTWVMERCPNLNSLAILEPTAQSLAILCSLCSDAPNMPFTDKDIAKLSLVGIIAMHCRKEDEEKFQNIMPQAYIQVANHYLDPDDDGSNYKSLLSKIKNIQLIPKS